MLVILLSCCLVPTSKNSVFHRYIHRCIQTDALTCMLIILHTTIFMYLCIHTGMFVHCMCMYECVCNRIFIAVICKIFMTLIKDFAYISFVYRYMCVNI